MSMIAHKYVGTEDSAINLKYLINCKKKYEQIIENTIPMTLKDKT